MYLFVQSFFFTFFQGHPEILHEFSAGTQGVLSLTGVARVSVREDHAFGIEIEVTVNAVLLREINLVDGVRDSLRAAAFPEKEYMSGLSPDTEKWIRRERRDGGGMLRRIVETVIAHFEHVPRAGSLFLLLLVLVERGTDLYEFPRAGCYGAVGYDIEVVDSNTVGAYPFEDMADSPDVERRLAARDVEMVDMPDMPQQVAYMPQGNIHGLGISPHAMGAAHVTAPGNLDTEILDIQFFHVRRL